MQQTLLITSFEDSVFHIAPIKILIDNDTVETNPLILMVGFPAGDSAFISKIDTSQTLKIRDVKKTIETPWTFKEFWQEWGSLVLIIFFTLLIGGAIIYYIKRQQKNQPMFRAQKPRIPAYITAIEQLDKLKEKKLYQKGKTKLYYTQLTFIIRNYIEKQFNIPALEYVTYQTVLALEHGKIAEPETIEKLKQILFNADFVKFAKAEPLEHENDLSLKNAYFFVETTKPKPVEIEEKEKNNEN